MGVFEILCCVGGTLIGAITGLAAGVQLPDDIRKIKKAFSDDDSEE